MFLLRLDTQMDLTPKRETKDTAVASEHGSTTETDDERPATHESEWNSDSGGEGEVARTDPRRRRRNSSGSPTVPTTRKRRSTLLQRLADYNSAPISRKRARARLQDFNTV